MIHDNVPRRKFGETLDRKFGVLLAASKRRGFWVHKDGPEEYRIERHTTREVVVRGDFITCIRWVDAQPAAPNLVRGLSGD